jgi:MFS family permease
MEAEPTSEALDSHALTREIDIEKERDATVQVIETPDGSLVEAPPMTFKRLMVLFSLSNLIIMSGVGVILLGAGICILIVLFTLIVAYTVADIGGASSEAWLGVANTLSVATVAPIAGSISDLIGRRYGALLATCMVCIGLIVVGTAHRMDVAIGGSAITGVGSGLAETIGTAGLLELAPVKWRGVYFGCALLVDLPFGAGLTYGIILFIC